MKIEIKIDESCEAPKVVIVTNEMTEEVNRIVNLISNENLQIITGLKDGILEILDYNNIYRIYSANGKVFANTLNGEYILQIRLYEIEQLLSNKGFVRISNSEIINLKKVKGFDLSFTGTICVRFLNKETTYVSRRYVSKIKSVLGIGGKKNEKTID